MRSIHPRGALGAVGTVLLALGWALLGAPPAARADILHEDDVIISHPDGFGSLCVGGDCVNGESFGFDAIRLKENNLRIHFNDTSATSSFPSNDWRIRINDTSNGGASYFAVDDATSGRTPFLIEAGAPTDSLRVDDGGRVGFGTSAPVVNLHVVEDNTPTLRLDQDGSSFTAQAWDVAGNEANFFIRDVTNGSKLPFRIKPGAPDASIFVSAAGDIGFQSGTTPGASLHVTRSNGSALVKVEETNSTPAERTLLWLSNHGAPGMLFEDTDAEATWSAGMEGTSFVVDNGTCTISGGTGRCLILESDGDLLIDGALAQGSSRAIKWDIQAVDPEDVLERLAELPIALWRYQGDAEAAQHLGPMSEDFRAAFALGSNDRHLAPADTAGVALAAVQGLYQQLHARDREIALLQADREALTARLDALERSLALGSLDGSAGGAED